MLLWSSLVVSKRGSLTSGTIQPVPVWDDPRLMLKAALSGFDGAREPLRIVTAALSPLEDIFVPLS
jgi:hypothetical protein